MNIYNKDNGGNGSDKQINECSLFDQIHIAMILTKIMMLPSCLY